MIFPISHNFGASHWDMVPGIKNMGYWIKNRYKRTLWKMLPNFIAHTQKKFDWALPNFDIASSDLWSQKELSWNIINNKANFNQPYWKKRLNCLYVPLIKNITDFSASLSYWEICWNLSLWQQTCVFFLVVSSNLTLYVFETMLVSIYKFGNAVSS